MSGEHATAPDPRVPNITVTARVRRVLNGVEVTLDEDRAHATIDVGRVRSHDLVSVLTRIANTVFRCVQIDIVGEDGHTLNFVATELPRALMHAEPWIADDYDDRRQA